MTPRPSLLDAQAALAELHRILAQPSPHGREQHLVQVGAMDGKLRPVVAGEAPERLLVDELAVTAVVAKLARLDRAGGVLLHCDNGATHRGRLAVGADGIHSVVRRQLYPDEGPPRYSGVNMWRGATPWPAFLAGDIMVSTGWLTIGKTVVYPIRRGTPATGGRPLINWVAELERPQAVRQDWTGRGRLSDMMPAFAGLSHDWLDITGMIESTEEILEYPMVDRDPLERWSFGRVTLLGDAAHPMYPRGSNGASQAIIDARCLTGQIKKLGAMPEALVQYEAVRNPATAQVVLTNRTNPPDSILREVWQRSGDRPFRRIEDVISTAELQAILDRYSKVSGFDRETLRTRPSFV